MRVLPLLLAPLLGLPALAAPALASDTPAAARADAAAGAPRLVPGATAVLRGTDRVAGTVVPEAPRRSALRTSQASGSQQQAASATFVVSYTGFTTAQRDAFQAAVDTWARVLTSPVPIRIEARLSTLPPGVLGAAGPTAFAVEDTNGRYDAEDTLLPIALANALEGRDLDPDDVDISAEFSNDASLFSYSATPRSDRYDFTTVVLHEIGHGLGFAGAMEVVEDAAGNERGTYDRGEAQPRPLAYDRRTVRLNDDGSSTPLLDLPRDSAELAQALTDGRVQWTGPAAVTANGGERPELYTPADWEEGSSYSHLDERTFPTGDPDSLMTPTIDLGEVVRDPGAVAIGMLADMGWGSETATLRLSGPSTAAAGTRVPVSGAAPAGSTVRIYFKRRGNSDTSPGAQPGFTLQREIPVGTDGTFVTSYVATDDHRYYAQVDAQTSEPVLTQVRPTFSTPLVQRVPRGSSVSLTGRGLPGTRLTLRFTRGTSVNVLRTVTVRADGTWNRGQVLTQDLRVGLQGANGQRSDSTALLQAR